MSDDERRESPTRRKSDVLAPSLRQQMLAMQQCSDKRHNDNLEKFAVLEAGQRALLAKLDAHSIDDLTAQKEIHECLDRNTKITEDGFRDMRDSMLLLVVKDGVMKTWTLAQWIRKGVIWLATFVVPVVTLVGLVLWALGKAEFPRL